MIGTLQSSNFFALKESPLRAVNIDDEPEPIGGGVGTMSYGFAAPDNTAATEVGVVGAYTITPLQLDLAGSETYTWTLEPSGQDLLGLSLSSGGEISGDITDSIEHVFSDFENYAMPSLGEQPPNGSRYGFFEGKLVILVQVRASGGPEAGLYETQLFIYPLVHITGSLTRPEEFSSEVEPYEAKQYTDPFGTVAGIGWGTFFASPIYFPGSSTQIFPIVEYVAGSGWKMRVLDDENIEYESGFSSTPYGTFNVTRISPGWTSGGGTFTVAQAS